MLVEKEINLNLVLIREKINWRSYSRVEVVLRTSNLPFCKMRDCWAVLGVEAQAAEIFGKQSQTSSVLTPKFTSVCRTAGRREGIVT